MRHAIWDRELRRRAVGDHVEVCGLACARVHDDVESVGAETIAAFAHQRSSLDRRMRTKAAWIHLDPIAVDPGRGVAVERTPGPHLRPAPPQHSLKPERAVDRTRV